MPGGRGNRLEPAVAGTWYPSDPGALREQVARMLGAHPEPEGRNRVRAVIAPHAGFEYSGLVAASVFRRLAGQRPARIVLIGPSHYETFDGAAVPCASSIATPLGEVPFDQDALRALALRDGVTATDRPFLPEHSLEAEIPFLQEVLPGDWRLIPMLIGGGASEESLGRVATALGPELAPDTLMVVSSDFTHYGRRFGYLPFTEGIPDRLRQLDLGAVKHILDRDPDGFRKYVARTGATICGKHAIDVMLRILPDFGPADLGAYDTSGNLTGSWEVSVSYAGIALGERDANGPPSGEQAHG